MLLETTHVESENITVARNFSFARERRFLKQVQTPRFAFEPDERTN